MTKSEKFVYGDMGRSYADLAVIFKFAHPENFGRVQELRFKPSTTFLLRRHDKYAVAYPSIVAAFFVGNTNGDVRLVEGRLLQMAMLYWRAFRNVTLTDCSPSSMLLLV